LSISFLVPILNRSLFGPAKAVVAFDFLQTLRVDSPFMPRVA